MTSPSFLSASVFVACGGGLGAWLRFVAGRLLGSTSFPWATLGVNLLGSFAMGLLAGTLARSGADAGSGESWRLLLGVGVLGGFTTFSAFSLDLVGLLQRGTFGLAAIYALASLGGGVIGLALGLAMAR